MASWYKITLTPSQVAQGVSRTIWNIFYQHYLQIGGPPDVALFSSVSFGRDMRYYLSPACHPLFQDLIAAYAGVPCEEPTESLTLSVGLQDAWEDFGPLYDHNS